MGADIAFQVKMGLIYPQNVPWPMFFHFYPCKEFQSKRFFSISIIMLKSLNMLVFAWVELWHFMKFFLHCAPCYVHTACNCTYRLCFPLLIPLLLKQQSPQFPQKQVSFSFQMYKISYFKLYHNFPQILQCHWLSAHSSY